MEENIVLLNKLNEILTILSEQNDEKAKLETILNNLDLFEDFNKKVKEIANVYLMKEYKNIEQNENADKLRKILVELIRNHETIRKIENIKNLSISIINTISFYENRFIFRLRHSKKINIVFDALDYQLDREEYKEIIKKSIRINGNSKLGPIVKEYREEDYEETMLDHIMRILRTIENKVTKEDIKSITNKMEKTKYIKEFLSKDNNKLSENEIILLERYATIIVGLKSRLVPQLLSSDILIEKFINGKLENEKILLCLSNSLPIDIFENVLLEENKDKSNNSDKKIEDLNNNEIKKINDVLKKAGIKISIETRIVEDDSNYLVTIKDLKNQYEKLNILQIYQKREEFYKTCINVIRKKEKTTIIQRRSYLEISTIISMMTNQMRKKIDSRFIEFIEKNKLKNKKCDINPNVKLENQKITNEETIALIAIIYKDCICSEEEREEIEKLEKIQMLNIELEENKERYNKIHNLLNSLKKKN